MKFIPVVTFDSGQLRPLKEDDIDSILAIHGRKLVAGQSAQNGREQAKRMIELSVQMAATQRGMIWAAETANGMCGMISLYDWQPTQLKTRVRIDALDSFDMQSRKQALEAALGFLHGKYHLRNFSWLWTEQEGDDVRDFLGACGFSREAVLRDYHRTGAQSFTDVELYSKILEEGSL